MKKIFFIAVFMTVLISCKKENTSPTSPSQTTTDDERVSMVVLMNFDSTNVNTSTDTIFIKYNSSGKCSKIYNNSYLSIDFIWDANGNLILNDTLGLKLDSDKNCVFDGTFSLEYKNGYLSRYGIDKSLFVGENNIPKDTFFTCTWFDGNLISDGAFKYEYDLTKLNNNISNIHLDYMSENVNDKIKSIGLFPFTLFNIPGFYQWTYGKSSKNLVSKVLNIDGVLLYDIKYDFDDKNRIKQITHTGSSENFVTKYIWSKY
jgi:hypothetical protein